MSSTLNIRLVKRLEGTNLSSKGGVKTNIYGHHSGEQKLRSYYNLIIPVGNADVKDYLKVEVEPGSYSIECILPSGDFITEDISIQQGENKYVQIKSKDSPHEYMALQDYYGNVSRQQVSHSKIEPSKININRKLGNDFQNRVGDIHQFDVKSFLKETFGGSSNKVYRNSLESAMEKGRGTIDERIQSMVSMIDSLLFDGLIEVTGGLYGQQHLQDDAIWKTLLGLIGPNAQEPLLNLMEESHLAKEGSSTMGLSWIEPKLSTDINLFEFDRESPGNLRRYLLWTPAGAELITLPSWWRDSMNYEYVPIEVMVDISARPALFRTGIAVRDHSLTSALAYLQSGALPTAGRLIQKQAENMLYSKVRNPYSAAVGAFILMESKYGSNVNWKEWVTNLYNWFEWFPDSAILKAWLYIDEKEWNQAKKHLIQAYNRGLPLYTFALKKLLEGLKLFEEDSAVKEIFESVRKIAWRSDPQQLFTVIRIGLPEKKLK